MHVALLTTMLAIAAAVAPSDGDGVAAYTVAPGLFDADAIDLGLRPAPGTQSSAREWHARRRAHPRPSGSVGGK
jgi:hypothetical protein